MVMEQKQYLTFTWHDLQYGIEAAQVQEIFPLPELIIIPEAPSEVIGILNFRGQMLPIIHLDSVQGHPLKTCKISDYVLILQWDSLPIGLVVHQVSAVLELNTELIKAEFDDELLGNMNREFITGVAQEDEGKIFLLNLNLLIRQPDILLTLIWDVQSQLDAMAASPISESEQLPEQEVFQQDKELKPFQILPNFYDLYCPDTTPEEREIFRQRADSLKPSSESTNLTSELIPLAVIGFDNEYFGLDLDLVREFTDMSNLTPIPCCPNHIVGNMNLRGEIVTLVDIRNLLNLSTSPLSVGSPTVVVQIDDIVAGLPVDQVLEMVYLNSADIRPLPAALSTLGEQFLRGTAFFQEKMLRVLDLPKIFTQGGLVVNEEA